jgi:excinuclease ABC subunit C
MHTAKRNTLKHSRLEEIPGIGVKKAQILLKAFGSMAAVKKADQGELARVKGITAGDALAIVSYFKKEDT